MTPTTHHHAPFRLPRSTRIASLALLTLVTATQATAQTLASECGSLHMNWGPFDYRPERYIPETTYRSHNALKAIVEDAHFTPAVEMLIRGKTGTLPGGDLSYTLGIFPNHHRALISISNLALREKSPHPRETKYSVECYFQRALVFRPDDHLVRMIYANYLLQIGNQTAALTQLDVAATANPDNPFTQRNVALLYADAKNFEKALAAAHKAAALGLNIDAVKLKLEQAGQWKEASPEPPASSAAQ